MTDSNVTPIEVAEMFRQAAEQFEKAAAHCRVSAGHFTQGEIPRGCAHQVAADGHIAKGRELLRQISVIHSDKARLPE